MMHQDSLEPAAIRFTLERLQESAGLKCLWITESPIWITLQIAESK